MSNLINLYPFNTCITKHSPYIQDGNRDFVVIYPAGDEGLMFHDETLAFHYLSTAENIVQYVYSKKYAREYPDAGDDGVAIPILHLYSHAIELMLKILIKNYVCIRKAVIAYLNFQVISMLYLSSIV